MIILKLIAKAKANTMTCKKLVWVFAFLRNSGFDNDAAMI
jgi:hypothetical protein